MVKYYIFLFLSIFGLISPSFAELNVLKEENNVVILGGGVGALTSAIYLARAGNTPILIEGENPGGLITQSHSVENWPGEIKISGENLYEKIKEQAIQNGCIILSKEAIDVDFSKKPYTITLKDVINKKKIETIKAKSIIIAMGTSSNYLNVEGEKKFWGKGVSNCAVCDGSLYRDKTVAVVGGGDAAVLEASYLSNIASKVYIFVRKDILKAKDKDKVNKLKEKKNIEFIYNTEVISFSGDENLKKVKVKENKINKEKEYNIDGLFLAIGSTPNSKIFTNKLELDQNGYIKVKENLQTSKEGIFAIGDIIDPVYKQAITAASDGAKAAIAVNEYIETNTKPIPVDKKEYFFPMTQAAGTIIIESEEHFDRELKNASMPVIVDFYASWCRPCKRVAPVIDQSAKELAKKVKILKVNVESNHEIAQRFNVTSMPTIVVFDKKHKMLFKKIGQNTIIELMGSLEEMKEFSMNDINNFLKEID